jgi:hypothetical protein
VGDLFWVDRLLSISGAKTECLRLSETFPNRNTRTFGRPKGVSDTFLGGLGQDERPFGQPKCEFWTHIRDVGHRKLGFGQVYWRLGQAVMAFRPSYLGLDTPGSEYSS